MDIYLIFVFILFALAISDLIVGVSNDAVNFLVSAIGSKAAPFWVIMIVASLGILVGATFSNGMMEVARKGIFHPAMFNFNEIMVIFMAVMITDILLLDLFNTFGMPTSTTVSIVFELLGGAVAVAFLKIKGDDLSSMGEYINTAKALAIISGILLSVVVAFSVGALVQYITRLIFTFKTSKTLKYYGSLWGGIAITAITYFILIKGIKGSSYGGFEMSSGLTLIEFTKQHTMQIIFVSFIIWTIILQLINWVFKVNILKIIVLAGTFALAMAFAGNDLVNFIGVPLAGLRSYETFVASGVAAEAFSMGGLAAKVATPNIYLLIAGFVMVAALIFSKKSRSVTKTSLNLSRQSEGDERFESSGFSRSIVRTSIAIGNSIKVFVPVAVQNKVQQRFEMIEVDSSTTEEGASFDLIRASVNLMVASILISFATSLKLPLSTTYVTFMVAMGTSLADGAWGRESAVYRITGVISVIGGWFLTAFIAFTAAFVVAILISWGGIWAVFALIAFVLFMVIRSHRTHKRREAVVEVDEDEIVEVTSLDKVMTKCNSTVVKVLNESSRILQISLAAVVSENRKDLKQAITDTATLGEKTKKYKNDAYEVILKLQQSDVETGHYYVRVTDTNRELYHSLNFITKPLFEHVDNNHKALKEVQAEELGALSTAYNTFMEMLVDIVKTKEFNRFEEAVSAQEALISTIDGLRKNQIKRIKGKEVGTRNSMLYLNTLVEVRNFLLVAINVVKAERDFVTVTTAK